MAIERIKYILEGPTEIADQVVAVVSRIEGIDIRPFVDDPEVDPNTQLAFLVEQLENHIISSFSVLSADLALKVCLIVKNLPSNAEIGDLLLLEQVPNRSDHFGQWANFSKNLSRKQRNSLSRLLDKFQEKYRYACTVGDIRKEVKDGTLEDIYGIGKLRSLFAQVAFFQDDPSEA